MDIFGEYFWQWLILLGILLFLIYSMIAIGKEKNNFLQDSQWTSFGELNFPIPLWWSLNKIGNNHFRFTREDTRYDWYADFLYMETEDSPEQILDQFLKDRVIEFDPDAIVTSVSEHLFLDSKLHQRFSAALRVEGKVTENAIERLYLDLYIFKDNNLPNRIYFLCSQSSVLNGIIEGPFFEEAIYRSQLLTGGSV